MTRKELLNSPEYWQGIAENQCYNENIDYTLQLVDKKQMMKKVFEWLSQHLYDDEYTFRDDEGTWVDGDSLIRGLKKATEE